MKRLDLEENEKNEEINTGGEDENNEFDCVERPGAISLFGFRRSFGHGGNLEMVIEMGISRPELFVGENWPSGLLVESLI